MLDRARALEAIVSSRPWSRYEMAGPRVLRLGSDAAVVVSRVMATEQRRMTGDPGR